MRIYNKFSLVLILLVALASCDLDRFPHDKIDSGQAFQSIKDAENWNNGVYAFFRARQYGIFTYSQDVQADQLNASLDFGNRNGELHRWTTFNAGSYTIRESWYKYYTAINNLNMILENYKTIQLEKDEDKALLNRYTGDAYFARAYYYFELAQRWSEAYDPATAASTLSVPIITTYDYTQMPARSTLKDVYDLILSDLSQAKTLLANIQGEKGAKKFTIDAVVALEARVKLNMKDWTGAYNTANSLITGGKYPLINNQTTFKQMWGNDLGQEVILQLHVAKPDELANTNSIYLGYNAASNYYSPDFVPSQWVVDMYDDNDIRKNVYFDKKKVNLGGLDYNDIYLVNKYPGNPELFTAANTNYQHAPKVFRIAEMYLIAAEAASHSSASNALIALNSLRQARGLDALSNLSGVALTQAIKDERFRELAFEGFRLFDLKRWGEGFERRDPQNELMLSTGNDFINKRVGANDDKFVWGLPSNDITINPNLKDQQNPGW